MPFNGSGVHVRVHDWTDDRDNEINIDADRMDAEHDDFAASINAILANTQGFQSGTAALPTINFHSDSDSGLFLESAGVVGLSIAGTKEIEFKAGIVNIINDLQISGESVSAASNPAFTASGSVSNGSVVILNNDGTVSEVSETLTDATFGGEDTVATSRSSQVDGNTVCYIGGGKYFVCYYSFSENEVRAKIATFDGENWSFGTEVTIGTTGVVPANSLYCAYDSTADRVIVAFDRSNQVKAHVCSVSGTTITANAGADITSAAGDFVSVACSNGYAVFVYDDTTAIQAICASIGSTSLSAGSEITISATGTVIYPSVQPMIADDFFVCSYEESDAIKVAIIERTSSTTIVAGTPYQAFASDHLYNSVAEISPGILACAAVENPGDLKFIALSYSGRTISGAGSTLTLTGYDINVKVEMQADGAGNAYMPTIANSDGYMSFVQVTNDGTSLSNEDPIVIKSASGYLGRGVAIDVEGGVVAIVASENSTPSVKIYDIAAAGTSTDADEWIGIAQNAAADTETVRVAINGSIASGLSGLTIGTTYYVDDDGSLTSSSAGGRKIGRATATTKLQITEDNVA